MSFSLRKNLRLKKLQLYERAAVGYGITNTNDAKDDIDDTTENANVDNEYENAGLLPPKICVTTSRDPSSSLKRFVKEVKLIFPNAIRINRGSLRIKELLSSVRDNEFTDIIVLHETRGRPDAMTICHLPHGPTATFTLYNVVTRHEILSSEDSTLVKTMSEAYPQLIFDNFSTKLGKRVQSILKYLYPPSETISESKRLMSFINRNDFISYRHHVFHIPKGSASSTDDIEVEEIGPRFEMQLYKITRGTIDQPEADVEYIRHHYTNSATTKKNLAYV